MRENAIFVDNFYGQKITLTLEEEKTHESHKAITGFHSYLESKEVDRQVISEIFKSLLLHDKILISTTNLLNVINAFGIEDTIFLVKTNKFEFVDDEGFRLSLDEKEQNKYSLTTFRNAGKNGQIIKSIEYLEKRLSDAKIYEKNAINVLLLNVEKNNKLIDTKLIDEHIIKETKSDIINLNITNYLNLNSRSTEDIKRSDVYNFLRLAALNKSLIYSSVLGVDNIVMDGAIKPILGIKLSPRLNISPSVNLFDSFFKEVFQKKNIPDLVDLYIKKIITIHDYIEITSTLISKRFRQWIKDKDYNPSELEKDIINSNPKISNKYVKFIRWTLPNAIGLIFPAAGVSASFADSYILEKFMSGWHPNLFLDDLLKDQIDKKVELHAKDERIASIKTRFPHIGRNDPCPCGSKLKFKKCCGRLPLS